MTELEQVQIRLAELTEACEDLARLTVKDCESLPAHALQAVRRAAGLAHPAPKLEVTPELQTIQAAYDTSLGELGYHPVIGKSSLGEDLQRGLDAYALDEMTKEHDRVLDLYTQEVAKNEDLELQLQQASDLGSLTPEVRELLVAYREELKANQRRHLSMLQHFQLSKRIRRISHILEGQPLETIPVIEEDQATPSWPIVDKFATVMKRKLEENKFKGGWQADRPHLLLSRAIEELSEVIQEMTPMSQGRLQFQFAAHDLEHAKDSVSRLYNVEACGDPQKVLEEAADVANMLMMVADVLEAFEEKSE